MSCLGQQAQPSFPVFFAENDSLHTISERKVERGSDDLSFLAILQKQFLQDQHHFLEMVNRTRGGAAFQLQLLGIM